MGLFKDNKNESRQFFEPDIQPDILEEKKEMLSEGEQMGSDIDRVINERSNDIEHMDILDDDSVEETAVITAGLTVTGILTLRVLLISMVRWKAMSAVWAN